MASSVIGSLRVNLGLDSAQFSRGAKQAQTTAQRLGRNLQKIGAAASAVGAGVALAVRGQLNAADQIGKTAQQIGLPVEALSQLQHAAKLSGVSMSSLERGLRNTGREMVNNADKFEELGVAVRDADGNMRPVINVFEDAAEELSKMEDGAEKTALAMQLFGERAGPEMIPLLNQGRDGIRRMREEADRLGLTFTEETAAAAAQFNDNLTRLSGLVQGVVRIMSAEFAPILATVSDAVAGFAERFQNLSPQMRRFIGVAGAIAVALGPVLIALGSLVLIVGAISAPVLLAVGAIAAITAGLVAFWPEIVAAKDALVDMIHDGIEALEAALIATRDGINEFTDRMIDLGNRGVEFVKEKLRELIAFLTDLPAQMRQAGADLMSGLVDGVTSGAARARDAVGNAARGLIDRFRRETDTRSPSRVFAKLGGDLMDGLAVGIEDRDHVATAAMAGVTDKLKDQVGDAASQISGMFETAFVGIVTGTQSAREAIGRLLQDLARLMAQRAFQSLFGGLFGGGGGFLSGLFGGFRADGGPVSSGRSYIVGERGPELFTPGASGQITSNENMRGGGGGGQLTIRLDLSQDVEARIMENTGNQTVQVVRAYDKRTLPGSVARVNRDPRARG